MKIMTPMSTAMTPVNIPVFLSILIYIDHPLVLFNLLLNSESFLSTAKLFVCEICP
jgi:hypothetical protein